MLAMRGDQPQMSHGLQGGIRNHLPSDPKPAPPQPILGVLEEDSKNQAIRHVSQ